MKKEWTKVRQKEKLLGLSQESREVRRKVEKRERARFQRGVPEFSKFLERGRGRRMADVIGSRGPLQTVGGHIIT